MATATTEIKQSYKTKELKIGLIILAIFISYVFIANETINWISNDGSGLSVIIILAIIWGSNLYDWTIWKLAGGWKIIIPNKEETS